MSARRNISARLIAANKSAKRVFISVFAVAWGTLMGGGGILIIRQGWQKHQSGDPTGTSEIWFGLIPLLFGLVGVGFLFYGLIRRPKVAPEYSYKDWENAKNPNKSSTRFTVWFAALWWNGACSVLGWQWAHGTLRSGDTPIVFIVVFPLVGVFILIQAIRMTWFSHPENRLKLSSTPPTEPMQTETKDASSSVVGVIFCALGIGLLGAAVFFGLKHELGKLLGCGAAGAGFLAIGTYSWLYYRKFGATTLRLKSPHGIMGEILEGELVLSKPLDTCANVKIQLQCLKIQPPHSDDSTARSALPLWSSLKYISRTKTLAPNCYVIPFRIQTPTGLPASQPQTVSERVFWQIEAVAELPGIDFGASFEVPIFHPPAN